MAEITGVVNSIIYRNTENGWTVLELCPDEGEKLAVVGALPLANVGERLELTGEYSSHPKYGTQFKATSYNTVAPATLSAIETYLGSGLIKGVGPATARAIVDRFGMETLAVLDDPRGGFLRVAVASPRAGAELYCMLALERACAQGNYRLPPNAFTVLDGFTAAEALTSKAEVERVKAGANGLLP